MDKSGIADLGCERGRLGGEEASLNRCPRAVCQWSKSHHRHRPLLVACVHLTANLEAHQGVRNLAVAESDSVRSGTERALGTAS
jgi:hypothetical protein